MSKIYRLFISLTILSACLVSCGGGGGGSDASSSTTSASAGLGRSNSVSDDYDAFEGGFPVISLLPNNNIDLLSCEMVLGVPSGSSINGQIRFERVPLSNFGLNYSNIVSAPARGVVVEAVDGSSGCSNNVVATGLTDANGDYGLNVPSNQRVCVRVRAQMYRSGLGGGPSWDVQVTDNTQNNIP